MVSNQEKTMILSGINREMRYNFERFLTLSTEESKITGFIKVIFKWRYRDKVFTVFNCDNKRKRRNKSIRKQRKKIG